MVTANRVGHERTLLLQGIVLDTGNLVILCVNILSAINLACLTLAFESLVRTNLLIPVGSVEVVPAIDELPLDGGIWIGDKIGDSIGFFAEDVATDQRILLDQLDDSGKTVRTLQRLVGLPLSVGGESAELVNFDDGVEYGPATSLEVDLAFVVEEAGGDAIAAFLPALEPDLVLLALPGRLRWSFEVICAKGVD